MTPPLCSKEEKINKIRQFSTMKILVAGDVMMDVYDFCDSKHSRPSPERPEKKVYTTHRTIKTIGGAGNVAANLAELGVKTSLIAIAGDDNNHRQLQALADAHGIEHLFIAEKKRITTIKTRIYIDNEYIFRRDDEDTHKVTPEVSAAIVHGVMGYLDQIDGVILSDYNKGFFTKENAQRIIAACRKKHVPVIVDLKPVNQAYFRGSDVVAPNSVEARTIYSAFYHSGETLETDVKKLREQLGSENVVVTLGKEGICGSDGKIFFHLPANQVKVVDPVGCGDTVRVALTLGCALKLPLEICADLANDAAAVVIEKLGTATLTQEELIRFIRSK